jgi:ABC-2 type transport system permease protein
MASPLAERSLMRAVRHVMIKEFLQLRRDRRMIPAMIVGPIMQLLVLGFAANLDVRDIPFLLVDHDRSEESRRFVSRLTGSGYFDLVGTEESADSVEPWFVSGRAQLAVVIGEGFAADLHRGRRASVQVLADGSDSNSSLVGLSYASQIVSDVGGEWLAPGPAGPSGHVNLAFRAWYNPELRSRWYFVPAVFALVLMLVTMLLPSMAIVREKEAGTLEQLNVTPLRPWQLIVGKLLPFAIIGLIDLLLVTAVATGLFRVPLRGSLLTLVPLSLLFFLNTLGLGLLVSTAVRTQQQAMMFSTLGLMVPMIYLSGLVFPIENMPRAIQPLTYVIPVRHYAIVVRSVFLKGSGLDVLWPEALMLGGLGLTTVALATARFRKSLD